VLAFRLAVLHLKILPRAPEVPPPAIRLPRTTGYVFPAHASTTVN